MSAQLRKGVNDYQEARPRIEDHAKTTTNGMIRGRSSGREEGRKGNVDIPA